MKIHFTSAAQLLGELFDYWDELVIGEAEAAALADKNGRIAILEMLDDPAAQRARWGSFRIRRGGWPSGISKIQPGSSARETARSDFYRWARSLPFASERDLAIAEAQHRFGPTEFGPCPTWILSKSYGWEPPE